jgi:hypothetical protein
MTAGSGKGRSNDRRPDITTEFFLQHRSPGERSDTRVPLLPHIANAHAGWSSSY